MKRYVLPVLLAVLVVALAYYATAQARTLARVRVQVEQLQTLRDSAMEEAASARQALQTMEAAVRRVTVAADSAARVHRERNARLDARADSITAAIRDSLTQASPLDRQAIVQMVDQLKATYEVRLADLGALLSLREETIQTMEARHAHAMVLQDRLTQALDLTTRQRDALARATSPSFLDRVWGQAGVVVTTFAVGVVAGILIHG